MGCYISLSGGLILDAVKQLLKQKKESTIYWMINQCYYVSFPFHFHFNVTKKMSQLNIFCSSMAHIGYLTTSIPENLQSMEFVCIYIQCKKWWTAYIPLSVWWGWVLDKTLYILEILICKVRHTLLFGFLCCLSFL